MPPRKARIFICQHSNFVGTQRYAGRFLVISVHRPTSTADFSNQLLRDLRLDSDAHTVKLHQLGHCERAVWFDHLHSNLPSPDADRHWDDHNTPVVAAEVTRRTLGAPRPPSSRLSAPMASSTRPTTTHSPAASTTTISSYPLDRIAEGQNNTGTLGTWGDLRVDRVDQPTVVPTYAARDARPVGLNRHNRACTINAFTHLKNMMTDEPLPIEDRMQLVLRHDESYGDFKWRILYGEDDDDDDGKARDPNAPIWDGLRYLLKDDPFQFRFTIEVWVQAQISGSAELFCWSQMTDWTLGEFLDAEVVRRYGAWLNIEVHVVPYAWA